MCRLSLIVVMISIFTNIVYSGQGRSEKITFVSDRDPEDPVTNFIMNTDGQYCGHFLTLEVCINQQVT